MNPDPITHALIGALHAFASTVGPPALALTGALLFQTPIFGQFGPVAQVWTTLLGIADTLLVIGLVIVALLVMSAGTFETSYTAKRLLPRVVLAAVMSNVSLALIGSLTQLNNGLVAALVGPDPESGVWNELAQGLASADPGIDALSALVSIAAALLALLLVVVCILRAVALVVLTVVAPLALATYAVPQLDEVASLWWRVFMAALFVQLAQAVVVDAGQQLVAHVGWLGAPVTPLLGALVVLAVAVVTLLFPLWAFRWAVLGATARLQLTRSLVALLMAGG